MWKTCDVINVHSKVYCQGAIIKCFPIILQEIKNYKWKKHSRDLYKVNNLSGVMYLYFFK